MQIVSPNQVNGFLVVRLPEMNKEPSARERFSSEAPHIGSIYYNGIDRMPWFDIDEEFYTGTLPASIQQARTNIKKDNPDLSGIELCKDIDTAIKLLEYSNQKSCINELIVLRSTKLSQIKSTFHFNDFKITWIGYDIVSLGNWSLLCSGLFVIYSHFTEWINFMNHFGLFSSAASSDMYVRSYEDAASRGVVEELPGSAYGIDVIQVGRIHLENLARSSSSQTTVSC